MEFTNAKSGLRKIFSAEILQIIGVPVFLIGSIMTLVGTLGLNPIILLIGSFATLAGFILMIIAFILNIVGVAKASKNEPNYKVALIVTIVAIVLSILSAVFSGIATMPKFLTSLTSALASACEIIVILYVCQGSMNLLAQIGGHEDLIDKGRRTSNLVTGAFCFSIILNLCVGLFVAAGEAGLIVGVVLVVIAAAADIIGYIWYLIFIKKASNVF